MSITRRLSATASLAAATVLLAACSGLSVVSDFDPSGNFTAFQTFEAASQSYDALQEARNAFGRVLLIENFIVSNVRPPGLLDSNTSKNTIAQHGAFELRRAAHALSSHTR